MSGGDDDTDNGDVALRMGSILKVNRNGEEAGKDKRKRW